VGVEVNVTTSSAGGWLVIAKVWLTHKLMSLWLEKSKYIIGVRQKQSNGIHGPERTQKKLNDKSQSYSGGDDCGMQRRQTLFNIFIV
jgi:hypothetical protein